MLELFGSHAPEPLFSLNFTFLFRLLGSVGIPNKKLDNNLRNGREISLGKKIADHDAASLESWLSSEPEHGEIIMRVFNCGESSHCVSPGCVKGNKNRSVR